MMRGLAVAGPRPSQGVVAQIKSADIEDVSRLGVELLARLASGLGQRRLTHRNPDLRVTSIDQRGASIAATHTTEIERQGSTQSHRSLPSIAMPARAPLPTLPPRQSPGLSEREAVIRSGLVVRLIRPLHRGWRPSALDDGLLGPIGANVERERAARGREPVAFLVFARRFRANPKRE